MASQTRLFVGNLPDNISEKDLHAAFSEYGEITNLDLKTKASSDDKRNFAFITLSCSHHNLETCINYFGKHNLKGQKLYVTRARESFLERLQRERQQEETNNNAIKAKVLPKTNPVINLSNKLNPQKRKVDLKTNEETYKKTQKVKSLKKSEKFKAKEEITPDEGQNNKSNKNHKKEDADKKRMESIKKKRQEFKEKQAIIKTGLLGIDKVHNKKIIFPDDETSPTDVYDQEMEVSQIKAQKKVKNNIKKKVLLDDDDGSEDEINFDIKKQFEGKNGQKVLDLQSRYKSDKRFVLDEKFIDDEEQVENADQSIEDKKDIEMGPDEEKARQLDILQDVLGVAIKRQDPTHTKKNKSTLGMLRFDPTQPEHAKFLAPVEDDQETLKKAKKKKKEKQEETTKLEPQPEQPKPEVSKEQFYKISETLKEAIVQPTSFSLRSLFGNNEEESKKEDTEQQTGYIPLQKSRDQRKKNPLEPGEKNPFVYDSSDSEDEGTEKIEQDPNPETELKAVWKEKLFFSLSDYRLKDGLAFFNKTSEPEIHKERRELKSLMKKRIYNKERKNQMFQKKIGGRKKTMKKSYRKKP